MTHHWMFCLSPRCLLVAAAFFVIALPLAAQSQTAYPTRNIRMIVPSPTGGPSDIVLPGYDFASWGGVFAPARTPRAVVLKLNAAIGAALENPDIARRFNEMGLVSGTARPRHSASSWKRNQSLARVAREKAVTRTTGFRWDGAHNPVPS